VTYLNYVQLKMHVVYLLFHVGCWAIIATVMTAELECVYIHYDMMTFGSHQQHFFLLLGIY